MRGDGVVEGERGVHRVAGDVRDRCGQQAAADGRRRAGARTARRTCAGRRTAAPARRRRTRTRMRRCFSSGRPGVGDEHLAAHAEVREHGVVAAAVELQPQVLAAAPGRGDRAARQPGGEVGAAREVAAHRARVGDRRRARSCGRRRGRPGPAGRPRPRAARARRSARAAPLPDGGLGRQRPATPAAAAFCSASFLVRPPPDPRARPPTTAVAVNSFEWSGPLLGDPVLGHAEVRCRRQLLQAGLPVQAGARAAGRAQQRVEQPVHDLAGGLQPCSQVDRADQRLGRVGEDAGLGRGRR